jgi:tRNA(Ile)-lysidine synthase
MAEIDRYLDARGEDILTEGVLRRPGAGAGRIGEAAPAIEEGRASSDDDAKAGVDDALIGISGSGEEATKVELDLPRLASYDPILQRYALRSALRQLRGDLRGIGYQHIDSLVGLCRSGATGYMVELPGGIVGLREGRTLSLWSAAPIPAEHVDPVELQVPGSTEVPGSRLTVTTRVFGTPSDWRRRDEGTCTAWFDLNAVELPLVVRSRRPGDRILGLGLPRETKTKNLLIDAGVPRRLREAVPILSDRSRILWIAGVRRSAHALLHDGTEQVLEVKLSSPTFKKAHS